jgi:hypothetical protein
MAFQHIENYIHVRDVFLLGLARLQGNVHFLGILCVAYIPWINTMGIRFALDIFQFDELSSQISPGKLARGIQIRMRTALTSGKTYFGN